MENRLENASENLEKLATNMFDKFTSISNRVQEYYVSKELSVDNYEQLVQEVDIKQDVASTALVTAKNTAANFDCEGDDPKAQLVQYRKDMKDVISSLKEYRTSVKDLIVAVKNSRSQDGEQE